MLSAMSHLIYLPWSIEMILLFVVSPKVAKASVAVAGVIALTFANVNTALLALPPWAGRDKNRNDPISVAPIDILF
jgi:hypothetical protein